MNNPLPLRIHALTKPSGEHFPALVYYIKICQFVHIGHNLAKSDIDYGAVVTGSPFLFAFTQLHLWRVPERSLHSWAVLTSKL